MKNSNEAELKRKRTSLIGKIKRRHATADELRHDARSMETELRLVEQQLSEFKRK